MNFFFHPLERYAYDLVLIDCPWKFVARTSRGEKKSANAKYETMELHEIAQLPVRELLRPGGVVVSFCTWPLFGPQHLICENSWGLTVKTGAAWTKVTRTGKLRPGTGFIFQSVCEPILVATLPKHKLRAGSKTYNLIECLDEAEVRGLAREHSRKPEEIYQLLERMTPGWRRADVFARQRRPGWDAFGKDLDKYDE